MFYLRNYVSHTMPGVKDIVSVKSENGKRIKLQKQLLLLNLEEIFELYKEEYPESHIGFTKFSLLRPKQCVLADSSGTHNICVCPYHQNVKLIG